MLLSITLRGMGGEYSVGGVQQIGIGVDNLSQRWDQMRTSLGFDTVIFRERADAALMTHYTHGVVQGREALLALNLYGGGGVEVWQYTGRTPRRRTRPALPGDLGIYAARLRTPDVNAAHDHIARSESISCGPVGYDAAGTPCFFCRDADDNLFSIGEAEATLYRTLHPVGGVDGAIIGCSDIAASLPLYRDLLGYDTVIYDTTEVFDHTPTRTVRRMLLTRGTAGRSPFSVLYGRSAIELWQLLPDGAPAESHLFHGRQWGDVGFIHLCFEVVGMDAILAAAERIGVRCTVDSKETFAMGAAGGRFAYLEDADGTLIELVETHRVRLLKIPPLSINVAKRATPLPAFVLKMLILKRARK